MGCLSQLHCQKMDARSLEVVPENVLPLFQFPRLPRGLAAHCPSRMVRVLHRSLVAREYCYQTQKKFLACRRKRLQGSQWVKEHQKEISARPPTPEVLKGREFH